MATDMNATGTGGGSMADAQEVPSPTQLLFARAVILTMDLWPAMRLAVAEQWGGIESLEKRNFLISHICDTYSDEQASTMAVNGATVPPPPTPDVDDLADTLQMYFDDEYESRIEDGSNEWVAGRIVNLHKCIYTVFPATNDSLAAAHAEVEKLYQATLQLRGQKVSIERSHAAHESGESCSEEGEDDDENENDDMQVDQAGASGQTAHRQREEPIVDEDGFTTVVKGRRRP